MSQRPVSATSAIGPLRVSPPVHDALREGRPVVALESTIISHGLPRPRNLHVARLLETTLTDMGVCPATIAVVDGTPTIGLDPAQLERIATDTSVAKLSSRDLPAAMAQRRMGATTVSATSTLAALAGIRVFSTGGLGGVHRGRRASFDESADLTTLARTRIAVVAAGVKSILDIPATLERLETFGVEVVGVGTDDFPAFWRSHSGLPVDWRADGPEEVVDIWAAGDALGRRSALVVANPLPEWQQLDETLHDRVLDEALGAAEQAGLRGKAVSPFLLDHFQRATGGRSLEVNIDIARNNVALGGRVAAAMTSRATGRAAGA